MRVVLSYIMKFIQSISFFLLSLSLILIFTVFNEDYVLDLLNNHNYYQELYDNTLEEVSYYLEQSGLNEEVLNNVISVKSLKNEIIVFAADGAIAAPMLLASFIPRSVILPIVQYFIFGPLSFLETRIAPDPVTVH